MLQFMRDLTQPEGVLAWLYIWHHTSAAVIERLLMTGKKHSDKLASNLLRRMSKQGWIRPVDNDELQGQYIYMLTEDGLEEILSLGLVGGVDYDLKTSSINFHQLRHDLGVQFIVAHLSNHNNISNVMAEHTLRSKNPMAAKIPDAMMIIELENGEQAKVAIEFEREEKAGDRLERFLWHIADDLTVGKYSFYMIYSRIPGIMKNYEAASAKPLNVWTKNPTSKRWEPNGKQLIPPDTQQKMRFRYLPELSAVLSPRSYRRQPSEVKNA